MRDAVAHISLTVGYGKLTTHVFLRGRRLMALRVSACQATSNAVTSNSNAPVSMPAPVRSSE